MVLTAVPAVHLPPTRPGTKSWNSTVSSTAFLSQSRVSSPNPSRPLLPQAAFCVGPLGSHRPITTRSPTPPDGSLAHNTLIVGPDLSPGTHMSYPSLLPSPSPKHDLPLAQAPAGWPHFPGLSSSHSVNKSGMKATPSSEGWPLMTGVGGSGSTGLMMLAHVNTGPGSPASGSWLVPHAGASLCPCGARPLCPHACRAHRQRATSGPLVRYKGLISDTRE